MLGKLIGMLICAGIITLAVGHLQGRVALTDSVPATSADAVSPPAHSLSEASIPQRAMGGRAVEITKGRDGHFRTTVKLNYADTPVLIDTGASLLAIRQSTARKAGIFPHREDYIHEISTANGRVGAARVAIRQLEIGTVRLRDVEAFVLPDTALSTNLLGMNVLSEFGEVSIRGDRLILDTRAG